MYIIYCIGACNTEKLLIKTKVESSLIPRPSLPAFNVTRKEREH